ncbi:MAG: polysaccharide deacetylase, partial [Clostridia bacterium]|nr:polysaccharide deacetylase [Clostridia bacterium]
GYTYFDWNYDCGDTSGYKKKQIVNSVLNHIKTRLKTEDYTIILLHDIKTETIKAVPEIIEYCLEQGYTLAGLDENSPNRQFVVKN